MTTTHCNYKIVLTDSTVTILDDLDREVWGSDLDLLGDEPLATAKVMIDGACAHFCAAELCELIQRYEICGESGEWFVIDGLDQYSFDTLDAALRHAAFIDALFNR